MKNIASKELKFNDLEKKYIDCFIGCLIIKLIPIDTSAEKYIKEIEENVKKNRVLKNSFLATESKKDSIGVHIIQTENKLIKEILKYQGISELKSII